MNDGRADQDGCLIDPLTLSRPTDGIEPIEGAAGARAVWEHHEVPQLVVREMTRSEFDEWRNNAISAFADEQIAAGTWTAEEAAGLAVQDNAVLLPDGFATTGMLFLRGVLPDGTPVGVVWIGLTHPRGKPDCAFIYDIEIDEGHRGAGHGRALLAAAEGAVRAHGVGSVELNVFGDNPRAIGLYASSGYRVVTQQMRKVLD